MYVDEYNYVNYYSRSEIQCLYVLVLIQIFLKKYEEYCNIVEYVFIYNYNIHCV